MGWVGLVNMMGVVMRVILLNTPNVTANVNATSVSQSDRVPLSNTDEEGELHTPPYNDDYNNLMLTSQKLLLNWFLYFNSHVFRTSF